MASLPSHGRLNCARCFPGSVKWGISSFEQDGWILENNPMSWGASNPRYLILGFSKGPRQCKTLLTAVHDDVPYAGFRHNVTAILRKLGLLSQKEEIDDRINESERNFAFGSLIRCSVAHVDPSSGRASKSGDIINRLSKRTGGDDWAMNCMQQFLVDLPSRLEAVVLLSNDDDYVEACFVRLCSLHRELRRINSVAYSDARVVWVHTVHGSPLAQSHINAWLEGANTTQGRKQCEAVAAISGVIGSLQNARQPNPLVVTKGPEKMSVPPSTKARAPLKRPTGSGRPVPTNPMRDAVHNALMTHPGLRPHPDQKGETKYIAAFVTNNGRTLALDKASAGRQPIWIEAHLLTSDALPEIAREFYPPTRGRNSNLHKLPGFKNGSLVRLFPESVDQAMSIIRLLGSDEERIDAI